MRYSDHPAVEVQERIHGDPEAIWNLVTDIDLPTRFWRDAMAANLAGLKQLVENPDGDA